MQRVLITGISGFVGQHLANFIKHYKDVQIFGLARNLDKRQTRDKKIKYLLADITDFVKLTKIIRQVRPDKIFHLAAQVSISLAWQNPQKTFEINVLGSLNVLEAVKALTKRPIILLVGSSTEYGNPSKKDLPLKETMALKPVDPYGASKACQSLLAYQYSQFPEMKVIYARSFNHTGPGQSDLATVSRWAKEIVEIEMGRREPIIQVSDLLVKRDFLDVRDVVRAYWFLLNKGKVGEIYNVCSGRVYAMRDILVELLKLSKSKIKIESNKVMYRQNDPPIIVGDNYKLRQAIGWQPKYDFLKQTLPDLLSSWRIKFNY